MRSVLRVSTERSEVPLVTLNLCVMRRYNLGQGDLVLYSIGNENETQELSLVVARVYLCFRLEKTVLYLVYRARVARKNVTVYRARVARKKQYQVLYTGQESPEKNITIYRARVARKNITRYHIPGKSHQKKHYHISGKGRQKKTLLCTGQELPEHRVYVIVLFSIAPRRS